MRLRWATAAPCMPSAVLVPAGRCAIVFWLAAAFWAFFTLRLAACACFLVLPRRHVSSCRRGRLRAALYPPSRLYASYLAIQWSPRFSNFPSPRKTRSGWPGPPRYKLGLRCGTPWWTAPAFRGRSAAACQRVVFAELSTDAMIATGITGKPAAARWIVESVVAVIRNAGWKRCCGCRCFPPGRTPKPAWPELEVQHAGLGFSYPS